MEKEHKAKYSIGPTLNSSKLIYEKLIAALEAFKKAKKRSHQIDYFISFLDSNKFATKNSKIQNINVVAYIPNDLIDFNEELLFVEQELNKK
jgi:hypothetical protein